LGSFHALHLRLELGRRTASFSSRALASATADSSAAYPPLPFPTEVALVLPKAQ
jgi:hypothetical protein